MTNSTDISFEPFWSAQGAKIKEGSGSGKTPPMERGKSERVRGIQGGANEKNRGETQACGRP